MKYFVGDLHGGIEALESVFKKIKLTEKDELYFVGDYVDRGFSSKQVLEQLMKLTTENENIKCVRGNHDDMFLNFIYLKDYITFSLDSNLATLKSFFPNRLLFYDGFNEIIDLDTEEVLTETIISELKELDCIKWLNSLPYYIETEEQIIVHAGINKSLDNWKDTSIEDFTWIRPKDNKDKNMTNKTIIMGHTPTVMFHRIYKDNQYDQPNIYFDKANNEIFIDTLNYIHRNAHVLEFNDETKEYREIV